MTGDPMAVDFAAIRTLRLVRDLGSFSRAAAALGVNQSTVSYTIDRLRAVFDDPLFVRQGAGIAPTQRCLDVVDRAGGLLDAYEALVAPVRFDPAAAREAIAVACNDYERRIILPRVVVLMRRRAPGVSLSVTTAAYQGLAYLKRGETDLLIGPNQAEDGELFQRHLLEDHYVCVMDRAHPLAAGPLDLDGYLGARHAVVTYGGTWRSPYLAELGRRGLALDRRIAVPTLSDVGSLLPGTDLISTVPARMAPLLGARLHVAPCPVPAPFRLGLVWTSRTHHSALHQWFRGLIAEVCRAIERGAGEAAAEPE